MEVNPSNHRNLNTTNGSGPLQHATVDVLIIAIAMSFVLSMIVSRTTPSASQPTPSTPLIKIQLNEAPLGELGLLPAIGPRMAEQMIQYRVANDRFGSWADLEKISGMGPATIETIQPWCVIEPAPDFIAQFDAPATR